MSLYDASVVPMRRMLGNASRWLDRAAEHAREKGFDPDVFVGSRLAPDQYPFARQVCGACDAAKLAAARLAGKEAPKHPDTEPTLEDLRRRVLGCVEYLGTFDRAEIDAAADRDLELPFLEGKLITGRDYLFQMALPNFYFHLTTAYAILRHDGVHLGKRDFIGGLTLKDRARA